MDLWVYLRPNYERAKFTGRVTMRMTDVAEHFQGRSVVNSCTSTCADWEGAYLTDGSAVLARSRWFLCGPDTDARDPEYFIGFPVLELNHL